MTTPVVIKMNNNEIHLFHSNRYNLDNLPKPNNKKLEIYEEKQVETCNQIFLFK